MRFKNKIPLNNSLTPLKSTLNIIVQYIRCLQYYPTTKMDRLFGKELSNLLQDHHHHNKAKHPGRIHSQSGRAPCQDVSKLGGKRFNRSSLGGGKEPGLQGGQQGQGKKLEVVSVMVEEAKIEHPVSERMKIQSMIERVKIVEPKDPQLVEEYFEDCFAFMLGQEQKNYRLKTNYMAHQTQINQKMRGILLDWIIDLHLKFKMFPQTLYATTMIIDLYLSKKEATKENLQLIGTAALYIAAKYEETYNVPDLQDLVHFSARAFSREQIVKMEADIIEALDFNLIMETVYRFFEPLARMCKMQQKNFHLAQYCLELALLDPKFLEYKPSIMASSSIYLINKIRKRPEAWPTNLEKITGYDQKELKNCARELCHLLERADDLSNTKSVKKKFSLVQFHEVTRIKLERRKQ